MSTDKRVAYHVDRQELASHIAKLLYGGSNNISLREESARRRKMEKSKMMTHVDGLLEHGMQLFLVRVLVQDAAANQTAGVRIRAAKSEAKQDWIRT
jgi:hypothetical protein